MSKLYKFIMKFLIVCVIVLCILIVGKSNSRYRDFIYDKIYGESLTFSKFRNFYNKYLGGVISIDNFDKVQSVFNEKINYTDINRYHDGAILTVSNNYYVPLIRGGIVVYTGEKDDYGNVIIVEDADGVYNWYGNICNSNVKMYDNLNNGDYVGESCGNYIYLVFSKDGNYLDYNKYIN